MTVPPQIGKTVYRRDSTVPGIVVEIKTRYGLYKKCRVQWQDGTESIHTIKELRVTAPGTSPKEIRRICPPGKYS